MNRSQRVPLYLFMFSCLFSIVCCCLPFTEVHIIKGTSDTTEITKILTTIGFCWIIIAAVLGIIIVLIYYKRALVLTIGIIILGGSLMLLAYGPHLKNEYQSEAKTFNAMSTLLLRPIEQEPVVDFKYREGYYLAPAFGAMTMATALICFITVKDEENDQ